MKTFFEIRSRSLQDRNVNINSVFAFVLISIKLRFVMWSGFSQPSVNKLNFRSFGRALSGPAYGVYTYQNEKLPNQLKFYFNPIFFWNEDIAGIHFNDVF